MDINDMERALDGVFGAPMWWYDVQAQGHTDQAAWALVELVVSEGRREKRYGQAPWDATVPADAYQAAVVDALGRCMADLNEPDGTDLARERGGDALAMAEAARSIPWDAGLEDAAAVPREPVKPAPLAAPALDMELQRELESEEVEVDRLKAAQWTKPADVQAWTTRFREAVAGSSFANDAPRRAFLARWTDNAHQSFTTFLKGATEGEADDLWWALTQAVRSEQLGWKEASRPPASPPPPEPTPIRGGLAAIPPESPTARSSAGLSRKQAMKAIGVLHKEAAEKGLHITPELLNTDEEVYGYLDRLAQEVAQA